MAGKGDKNNRVTNWRAYRNCPLWKTEIMKYKITLFNKNNETLGSFLTDSSIDTVEGSPIDTMELAERYGELLCTGEGERAVVREVS
jgi:hypothetical protein